MLGKAMDFYIPDVPLAKLRAIGLKMQLGGVGFYPTSGSPFVHMDTGNVRHWPRMTRQQLVRVFPNGHTLHIPSDGRPLPGYQQALAAYKARMAGETPETRVASFSRFAGHRGRQEQQAGAGRRHLDRRRGRRRRRDRRRPAGRRRRHRRRAPARRAVGTAVASYATAPVPLPRLAPKRPQPVAVASLAAPDDITAPARPPLDIATLASQPLPQDAFGNPQDWTQPPVPAALAAAMAERDQTRRSASLPIAPTAVVATIDVTRPLRAEAITTAVLRRMATRRQQRRSRPSRLCAGHAAGRPARLRRAAAPHQPAQGGRGRRGAAAPSKAGASDDDAATDHDRARHAQPAHVDRRRRRRGRSHTPCSPCRTSPATPS